MGLVNKGIVLGRMAELQEKFTDLAKGAQLKDSCERIGVSLTKLVADEFRKSEDPYGNKWAPVYRQRKRDVAARKRRAAAGKPVKADKPLVDTGRLRASVVHRVVGSGPGTSVRIALPVEYASHHQYGTKRITRRQILPEADTGGLPTKWRLAIMKELLAGINATVGPKKVP